MTPDAKATAVAVGLRRAEEVLNRRRGAHETRAAALAGHPAILRTATTETAGFLLALGDSWFDYPQSRQADDLRSPLF